MMKRFLIIIIITCLLIPFFTINSSAASYDLGDPVLWRQKSTIGVIHKDRYYTYYYDEDQDEVFGSEDMPWSLWFYKDGYHSSGFFNTSYDYEIRWITDRGNANYGNSSHKVRASDLDISKNVLAFAASGWVRERLYFPSIAYKGIYFPQDNQVIKVEFSIDTLKLGTSYDIPDVYNYLLTPDNLCWFELEEIPSNLSSVNSYRVPFSSVVVTPSTNGRVLHYTYYFNAYGDAFQDAKSVSEGSLLQLVIRLPYYFGDSSLLNNGVFCLTNADLPTSYEIMTPGDYSQELDNIHNAIVESNENLMNYYDTMTGDDRAVIVIAQRQNQKLDSTIKDYDNAQDGIDNIVENVTLPPVNIDDANASFEDLGLGDLSTNQYIWQGPVIAMAVVTFSFAILSLILYGKKE